MQPFRTGVDLGGTKIEAVVLGPSGEQLARERCPTPQRDYNATLYAITDLIDRVEFAAGGVSPRVGVGTPGSISPTTSLIRNANSTVLNGKPLDCDLSKRLARLVRLENDANCFAIAEATVGAGRNFASVFGVILGTGVGGAFVVDKKLILGRNGIAGEWGHNPLPRMTAKEAPGPMCYCGRRGCVETWLSGPGLAKDDGRGLTAAYIAEAVNDPVSEATLARHRERLARALSSVVNLVDPEAIVFGGGLSNLPSLAESVRPLMEEHVFSDSFETDIMYNDLGDSAGVIGAAWLSDEERA